MIIFSLENCWVTFIIMDAVFLTIYLCIIGCLNKYALIYENDMYVIDSKIVDLDSELESCEEKHRSEIKDEETKKIEKIEAEKISIDNRTKEIIKYIHKEKEKLISNYESNKKKYKKELEKFNQDDIK